MPKPRRSSTDRAAPVYAPAALDFEVMDGLGELLAVDWSVGEDDARFSKLRRLMTDPARVTAQLLKLPALGLLACEIVVEAGGLASWESVAAVLEERSGLDRATVARFLHGFQGGGVLTPAIALDRPKEKALVLLAPAAELVAERVWLLSAPPARANEALATGAPPVEASAMLAVAGLALHEPIKHTASGEPHRGNIKKHARRLALDERALHELVDRARVAGALRADPRGEYVTVPARMRAIAAGGEVRGPYSPLLSSWLAEGPRPLEVIVRAIARWRAQRESHGFLHSVFHREPYDETLRVVRKQLSRSSGVRRVEVDGVEWMALARAGAELPERVEGFVTPNLDVMVGPEPDPRVVARLALCAELVRIDRVLTFRLRPATVGRAVLAGMTGEEMVDVIGRVGRHGIPAGVRAQVLDWATNARVASAAPVTLLRVAARLHDEVVAALGDLVVSAPAPGVVLVAEGEPLETIRARLAASNVEVAGRAAPHDGREEPVRSSPDERETVPPPLPLEATKDVQLVRTIVEERAAGFAPSLASGRHQLATRNDFPDWDELRARAKSAPPEVRRILEAIARLHRAHGAEVEAWVARLPPEERGALDPMSVVPLLMIPPAHRRRILSGGAPVDEVLAEAGAVMKRGWLSVEGKKLAKAMRGADPEQLAEMLFGDEDDDESDLADEELEPPREAPTMTRGAVLALLRDVEGTDGPVHIWWDSAEGPSAATAWVEELRTRGREPVVLFTEVETEVPRAVPLASVRAVAPP